MVTATLIIPAVLITLSRRNIVFFNNTRIWRLHKMIIPAGLKWGNTVLFSRPQKLLITLFSHYCTEVRFASFLSGWFITAIAHVHSSKSTERKLVKRTSVYWPGCPNQPRIDFSYYEYIIRLICLLICAYIPSDTLLSLTNTFPITLFKVKWCEFIRLECELTLPTLILCLFGLAAFKW